MVLAQRIHLDVLDQNHVPVRLLEDGAVDLVLGPHLVAASEERHRLGHPLGSAFHPRAIGVVAQPTNHLRDEVLEGSS